MGNRDLTAGTGIQPSAAAASSSRATRIVKIDDRIVKGSGALADIRILWLTPSMDSLFTGAASERRRFLDRLALSLDPTYARHAAVFDRAMRQRNRALETFSASALLDALDQQMASAALAMAVARNRAVRNLSLEIDAARQRAPDSVFPWAGISLRGTLEEQCAAGDEEETLENYLKLLAQGRERDRVAGRTLVGPHRSDLDVVHGPKSLPAKVCSTGEQKALLVGLVIAQARLVKAKTGGLAPLVLLDEIAAHLDPERRLALFSSLASLNAQVWMTGTDLDTFRPLQEWVPAQLFLVSNGTFTPQSDAESLGKH
jgi:DNA replication and repair protein RecF